MQSSSPTWSLPASNDAFSCRTGDLRTERFWSAAPFTRWPAVRPKDLSRVQLFFINALQFLFSWTTNVSGIKRWQMHLEMDRSLRVNGITGWLAQSDVGFSRTNIPLGRTWQTKKHGMAKVAPALYVRRRQVDDILKHLFNPIPIRRFDESPQCWHACFDSGRPWLTMKYQMNLFNVQKSSLIAEEQCYLHQFFTCIDNFSLRRALSACLGGHWSKCISWNWTGRSIWWSFLFWIFFHGQQAIVVACCSLGNSGVEEIHRHGTVGALQGNPQAPGNRGIGRVSILGVQELQESLTALRVQKEAERGQKNWCHRVSSWTSTSAPGNWRHRQFCSSAGPVLNLHRTNPAGRGESPTSATKRQWNPPSTRCWSATWFPLKQWWLHRGCVKQATQR